MTTERRRSRTVSFVLAGVAAALLAGACSGGDSASAPAGSTTSAVATTVAKPTKLLKVAVVTPSAADDLAFSQPMIEALRTVATERGAGFTELLTTTEMFETDKARQAIKDYADGGANIIVAHSDAFGPIVEELAPQYPNVSFVWGTEIDTFGLPNVYSYGLAADEGAYVMGVLAAEITESDKVGVVGPIESGDAKLFVDGFVKGVTDTKPSVKASVTYINSYSDVVKAASAAQAITDDGADVVTGSSEAMAGAVPVVVSSDAVWFGNQWDHSSLAPGAVVASQVYSFEHTLREVFTAVERGQLGGKEFELNLANGGLVIKYNPGYSLPADVRAKGDQAQAAIIEAANAQ